MNASFAHHEMPESVTAKINEALLLWSNASLKQWQHEALRRILSKGALTEQDKEDIYERAQFDHDFSTPPLLLPNLVLTDADLPSGPAQANRIWLTGIKDLENVNALKTNQRLIVGRQLTVVYGENGSGKSGYARVLKKTARCTEKAIEPILPNVFTVAPVPSLPTAVFELDQGSGPVDVRWQDGQPVPNDLKRFAVFDSKCARYFLSDSNQLSFAPFIFEALRQLGEATDAIKQKFISEVRQLTPPKPPGFQFMVDQTTVGKALDAITVQTNPETIRTLGQWSDKDINTLQAKEIELAKLKSQSPQAIREGINREKRDAATLQAKVAAMITELNAKAIVLLQQKLAIVNTHEQAYEAAMKLALNGSKIEGVGSDAWKSLIEAAATFSTTEAYKAQLFPAMAEGALCVLCQQPLGPEAAGRLKGFWTFLQDDAAQKRDAARAALNESVNKLKTIPRGIPPEVAVLRDEYDKNHAELWLKTTEFFDSAQQRLTAIEKALAEESWDAIPALSEEAATLSSELVAVIDRRLNTVEDDTTAQATITTLTAEIAEFKARKQLSENLQLVLDHFDALKSAARAQKAADEIRTNAISLKAKELHTDFITDAFKARVKEYMTCVGLRRAKVAIGEKSERGKVLHSIAVEGGNQQIAPESIFSEGERTAISLAFFLADLGTVADTCGVVFDDPVTSLDHRIREGVVKALVTEAKERQVIVFTHDLSFYCDLISAATIAEVEAISNHLEAFSATVGHLSTDEPRETLKVTQRYGALEKLIGEAEKAVSPDDFNRAVDRFYSQLRAAWERSVEELLFNQVVARYQKEVMTQRLVGAVIDKEGIAAVFQGMTRSSCRTDAHDHAAAAALPTPTSDDLKAHLKELKDFVEAQKAKGKAAVRATEHLKGK
jgi:ABC-type cobalamin/Fe3+-siderophores transport system ATPase subunit